MSENTKPNNERPADLAVQDSVGGMARRLLNPAHLRDLAGRSVKTLREQGAEQLWRDVKFRVGLAMHHDDWRHRADIPLRRELKAQRAAHLQGPKISIIVPLYNTPAKLFDEMLQSVVRQTYTNWELVLVDASDADKRLERRLPKAVPGTIVYEPIENGGIALNTTRGFALAHGEYITLLDHDDVLYPNALFEVVQTIQNTGADFVYSDEIVLSADLKELGGYHFKPDFAPDYLRGVNFITHLAVFSRPLLDAAGAYESKEFDGAQDHDLILRLTEKAQRIEHIKKVLYIWRAAAGSTAAGMKPKVLARSMHLLPGDTYSFWRQNRTQTSLARLGIFKYTNLNVTRADSVKKSGFGSLDFSINAVYDLPIETEIEVDVSSKSNNLLGPGLSLGITNKNLFRGGENLTFKLNGAYEWEVGDKKTNSNSGLINSYELGVNVGLSLPRLLVPNFLKSSKDFAERTNFQIGVDFLNRHTFFRMLSFTGSLSYDFQSSWRVFHTITPLKITYTHLLQTSKEFDETMENNPAIAMSFKNQLIPSMSYSYTYDRAATRRNPNRLYWQNTIMSAGNILSAVQYITGNHQGQNKKLFGNIYSQFLKLTSEVIVYRKITETSRLATRFMGGIGCAYGNSRVMPYSEQFYIGGANSIRAFTIRSIGPGSYHLESDNKTAYLDQTGDIKLEGNVELRFKIMYQLNGAIFLDAGNVWLLRNDPKRPGGEFKLAGLLKEIALGTGFGLRYDFGFIVLRGDLGIALHTPYKNPDKSGYYNIPKFKDGLRFHLAIGYPF